MRRGLRALPAALAVVMATAAAAEAKGPPAPRIAVESSRAEHVTGGDALIAVTVPKGVKAKSVQVRLNGRPVPRRALSPAAGNQRKLVGVIDGMRNGRNVIAAKARRGDRARQLAVWNSPITGPVFSGPHQSPFFCTTEKGGLGPATDADCSAPTQVQWRYRSTGGGFRPLATPATRPADLAQTTTRDGRTVDYVVRVESGVINRSIYRWAVLAPGGDPLAGWNGRQIHSFGGGCGAGHQQGDNGVGTVLDHRQLSRGYSVASSSLTVLGTACNDLLSAETVEMTKEHTIESLGRKPVWTIGQGGSGGSVQAQLIAQNYPGLLDGLLPSASFPDNSSPDYPDCRLLQNYFGTTAGSSLTNDQRSSITGMAHPNGCSGLSNGSDVANASEGCDETIVPPSRIFDPQTNPQGIRCTIWDSLVNIYGRDPATGWARRSLDNVGVQYGLEALREGDISPGEFLDLNEEVGGFDDNGLPRQQRSVADLAALSVAYRTGRINQGAGGIPSVPIIDARNYVDEAVNVHQYVNTYRFRARLLRFNGNYANHVMLRAKGAQSTQPMLDTAIDLMGTWLDAIAAERSDRPPAAKVVANRPAGATDACWIGGRRINGPAVIGAGNPCQTTYVPHELPADRAGKPLDSIVAKCRLRPIDPAEYPSFGAGQLARLRAIFPSGVCDWTKPGVNEARVAGTWQEFGPKRNARAQKRKLRLRAKRRGGKVTLTVTSRPCPATTWQRVVFERKAKRGWRRFDAGIASGRRCTATARLKVRGSTRVRASAEAAPGFRSSRTRSIRIRRG